MENIYLIRRRECIFSPGQVLAFSSSVLACGKGDGVREEQREQGNGQQTGPPSEGLSRISVAILVSLVSRPGRHVKSTS